MSVWLIRSGAHGEFEQKFLDESRVYVTWERLDVDLSQMTDRGELEHALAQRYPDAKPNALRNYVSQIWPFAHEMEAGDLVVVPRKTDRSIQIGEIVGAYRFDGNSPSPYYHLRPVKWVGEAIPRSHFGQDLLHSFGASARRSSRVRSHRGDSRGHTCRGQREIGRRQPPVWLGSR